jgi:hypothetical protein
MDSLTVWIGAAVVLIGIAAYAFKQAANRRVERLRKEHASPNPSVVSPRGSVQRGRSARCEAERQKMRPLTNYNEEVIDRLVAFERDRMPHASEEELHSAAHERLVLDNR